MNGRIYQSCVFTSDGRTRGQGIIRAVVVVLVAVVVIFKMSMSKLLLEASLTSAFHIFFQTISLFLRDDHIWPK